MQSEVPIVEDHVPAAHFMQIIAPALEIVPALQVTQADMSDAPALGDQVPALQRLQTVSELAPTTDDHEPATQLVQLPELDRDHVPARQFTQDM